MRDCKDFWKEKGIPAFFLGLITLAASLPLMADFMLQSENLPATLTRIELVKEGLFRDFPVRIQPLSQPEYGIGAVFFQTDVFLLLPALFRKMGAGILLSWQLTMWLVNLSAAVIAYVCFYRIGKRQEPGILGSMLFVWCPYRIHDLYLNGDLGRSISWCFLPLLLLGLVRLYTEEENPKGLWILPTVSFSLIAASSMQMFLLAAGVAALWLVFMGKALFRKGRPAVVFKTAAATGLLNAWLFVPWLYFMYKNPDLVGRLIPENISAFGIDPVIWLLPFFKGGTSADFWTDGLRGVQSLSPGFAVTLCIFFYLWALFTKRYDRPAEEWSGAKLLLQGLVFGWMSSGIFPWAILQNRNMPFSVFLSWMQKPALWGVGVCLLFVPAALAALNAEAGKNRKVYKSCLWIAGGVSFLTTQFLIGNILYKGEILKPDVNGEWERLPMQSIEQIPAAWRLSEVISLATLLGLLGMYFIRRKKDAERIGIPEK